MTHLERQIRTAQRRLWLNHWFHAITWLTALLGAVFAGVVLVQRLYDLSIPLLWVGGGLGLVGVVASVVWMTVVRANPTFAAAKLDEAAGLRERLSSGHLCIGQEDPFAGAVVADAERVCTSLSARQHIRLRMPEPFAWSVLSIVAAAAMFLISPGLLKQTEAKEAREQAVELEQTKIAVKRKMDDVKRMAEANPALQDLKDELDDLDREAGGKLERPADLRHEAIKKIDKLADAVKQKRRTGDYEASKDMRKMLRGLKVPRSSDAPTQKLSKALKDGDFKSAKEEIKALQEQLATLKSDQDKELAAKISKQLDDIAKQLEKLAKDEKLAQQLKQAGIKKEDLERMLENLKKADLEQLKKQLQEKGMSQQQIEKVVKQLERRQGAGSMAQRLAQAMKKGAQCNNPGQMGEAIAGLTMATDDNISKPCSACKGAGCSRCQGKRGGMGRLGQGRGGLAPERQTAVDFKVERGKVHTGKGAIIGQFLFDGEQVKGEVSPSFTEVVTAAEHEASDRINRNRVPRQSATASTAIASLASTTRRSRPTSPASSARSRMPSSRTAMLPPRRRTATPPESPPARPKRIRKRTR
jgi:hypothetical protein